jgi:hypothetical protein
MREHQSGFDEAAHRIADEIEQRQRRRRRRGFQCGATALGSQLRALAIGIWSARGGVVVAMMRIDETGPGRLFLTLPERRVGFQISIKNSAA